MDLKIILFLTEILHHEKKKKKTKQKQKKAPVVSVQISFQCAWIHTAYKFFFISFFYLIVINTAYKL